MADRYQQVLRTEVGRRVAGAFGLPVPAPLRRYAPGEPILPAPVVVGGTGSAPLLDATRKVLSDLDVEVLDGPAEEGPTIAAAIFDASGIDRSEQLRDVFSFLQPAVRRLGPSSRVVVLGGSDARGDARRSAAQRALDGFIRSVGKEMRAGTTANLVRAEAEAAEGLSSPLRFFLSGRSAFVSGQSVRVERTGAAPRPASVPDDWDHPLAGKVALVTGAAQGIGAAIAYVLARDGADVVCLDIPAQGQQLAQVANRVGGSALQLDITASDAPAVLGGQLRSRHGGVDVVVHNAGITRDKTLAGMDAARWDDVLAVNLSSQERCNDVLLGDDVLRPDGRIVCVSSLSGIAGNRGQTNYAASKAGVLGMVEGLAAELAARGGTINAVAPGFIETAMTQRMPMVVREAGRRMNSLNQGGLPVDVAETIAWLASPGSGWVNGNTIRVCGQSLLGA